jgi:tetratricopeptide (TPR) repeat protein
MNSPTTGEEAARLKRQGSEQAIQLALESKWEEAAALNKTILAAHPSDVEAWNRLGKSLLELGRMREAHEAYGHSVQLDPVNTIAKRNLDRLSTLVDNTDSDEIQRPGMVAKASQDLFIEEIGKTGVTVLREVPKETVARLTAGDEVYLKTGEELIQVEDATGESIGALEPKLALRLLRMIEGGNKYAAAVKSLGDSDVELIIKEIFRDPSQTRLSFPATGGEGVRAYTRESLVRMGDDDDDDEIEETETEDWDGEPEPSDSNTVSFSSFQNTIERDVDDDDDGE